MTSHPNAEFAPWDRLTLRRLADRLLHQDPMAIETCVRFVSAETRGTWHGRARAMMCRRLKHCDLDRTHRAQLVDVVCQRLVDGRFSEQFKDQLRLAWRLDPDRVENVCRAAADSPKAHVRRTARWLLARGL